MVKVTVMLGLIFMMVSYCVAQDDCYYFKSYDHSFWDDSGEALALGNNGGALLVARGFASGTDVTWLVWLNECGDTILTRYFILSPSIGGEIPQKVFKNGNGGYVIIGFQANPSIQTGSSFIFNVSDLGDSVSHYPYIAGSNDRTVEGKMLSDHEFVCVGYNNASGLGTSMFYKVDTSGSIKWNHVYGDPQNKLSLYDIEKSGQQRWIIAGLTSAGVGGIGADVCLIETDSTGTIYWQKTYPTVGGEVQLAMDNSIDGGVIIAGSVEDFAITGSTLTAMVMKTDTLGDLVFRKVFDADRDKSFSKVIELRDGAILLVGTEDDLIRPDSVSNVCITKLDKNGELLWERKHHFSIPQVAYQVKDLQVYNDGSILVAGIVFTFSMTRNDAFVLKTDSCGYTIGDTTVADFTVDTVLGKQVWFSNTSDKLCSSLWYFGDGDSSVMSNPSHTYADTGYYTITLITKAANTSDTISYTFHLTEEPVLNSNDLYPLKKDQISVLYPNPSQGKLYVDMFDSNDTILVTIFSLQGVEVLSSSVSKHVPIDIGSLSTGIYIYRIQVGSTYQTGKLLIE